MAPHWAQCSHFEVNFPTWEPLVVKGLWCSRSQRASMLSKAYFYLRERDSSTPWTELSKSHPGTYSDHPPGFEVDSAAQDVLDATRPLQKTVQSSPTALCLNEQRDRLQGTLFWIPTSIAFARHNDYRPPIIQWDFRSILLPTPDFSWVGALWPVHFHLKFDPLLCQAPSNMESTPWCLSFRAHHPHTLSDHSTWFEVDFTDPNPLFLD